MFLTGVIVPVPTLTNGTVVLSLSQLHLVVVISVVWTLVVVGGGRVVTVVGVLTEGEIDVLSQVVVV